MRVSLGDVCIVTMGQAPSGDSYNEVGEGVPLIAGAGDFSNGVVRAKKYTTEPTKMCAVGDVVMSIRASIGDRVVADSTYCLGRGVAGLRAREGLSPKYLWHWLDHVSGELRGKGRGATFLQVNRSDISELQLKLPPLDEQRRIAAILDCAEEIRAARVRLIEAYGSLIEALFVDMFGDPDLSPNATEFGSLVHLTGGRSLVADDISLSSPYRVLKISSVTSGAFDPTQAKPLPIDYVPPSSHLVRDRDLLMSRANTADLVGAVAYVRNPPSNLALPDKIWRLNWKVEAEPVFYHALLSTPAMRRRIRRLASGTGGSMKNVSKAKLEAMPVPIVGLADQRKFADRARLVADSRALVGRAVKADRRLCDALQAAAFRGEL